MTQEETTQLAELSLGMRRAYRYSVRTKPYDLSEFNKYADEVAALCDQIINREEAN